MFFRISASVTSLIVIVVIVFFCASPVRAASVACKDHMAASDYVSSVAVNGDVKSVTYSLPLNEDFRVGIQGNFYEGPLKYTTHDLSIWGPDGFALEGEADFPVYPLGFGSSVSLADIRVGTRLEFTGSFSLSGDVLSDADVSSLPVRVSVRWFWFDKECNQLGYDTVLKEFFELPIDDIVSARVFSFDWSWSVPDDAVYAYPRFDFRLDVDLTNELSVDCTSLELSHDVNMILDNSNTMHRVEEKIEEVGGKLDDIDNSISGPGGTNDKLDDVKDNLDDIENSISGPGGTNDKLDGVTDSLDDIYEGGPSAGDLIDGGDKIADAGQDLGGDIDQIQNFENQYMGQFEENLDDIINSVDLNFLSSPLSMIQTCLNKTVSSIPSQYLVVFTLPALIGLFMYIVGHPIKISHLGRGDPAHRSFSPGPAGKGGDSG